MIGCTCTVQHPGIKITRKRFVKQSQLHEELAYAVDCLTVEMARRLWVRTDAKKTTASSTNCDAISHQPMSSYIDNYKGLMYSSYHDDTT